MAGKQIKTGMLLLCIMLFCRVYGQNTLQIEGRVISKQNGEPVAYANIFNTGTQQGTITNTDGYFKITLRNINDTVFISYIGYIKQQLYPETGKFFYLISLEENIQLLKDIVITASENAYLYDMVIACKKNRSAIPAHAKGYYQLQSFIDAKQTELVEGYYNVTMQGYDIISLGLKAGRFALQPEGNRIFASLESSSAITMLQLFDETEGFPANPAVFTKNKMKKNFDMQLDKVYRDDAGDSIYIIDYLPEDTSGVFFNGKLWIDHTHDRIVQITMHSNTKYKHPFHAIFPKDSITGVTFDITKTFQYRQDTIYTDHTDFIYTIQYRSRISEERERSYTVTTKAILYTYSYKDLFALPAFRFSPYARDDYRKINAMPYNDFFWTQNTEYRLHDALNKNDLYYNDPASLTNKTIFHSLPGMKRGFFEYPYMQWSSKRLHIKEIQNDSVTAGENVFSPPYKLPIKIFMDINTYRDSTDILTAAVLDPYETWYRLPAGAQADCFINIWFDICEAERRKFMTDIKNAGNNSILIGQKYNAMLTAIENLKTEYFMEVHEGLNEKEMQKWNTYIYERLGIDNIALFDPYGKQ